MTSGKSFIGKTLAERLKLPFIDLDIYIEKKEKMTISRIFKSKGEVYFRTIESNYLREILKQEKNYILSLGGGTPCYASNMDVINAATNSTSIYLKTSILTIIKRLIKEKNKRPLVQSLEENELKEFVAKHLFERSIYYNKANHTIETDNKDENKISKEIITLLLN